MLSMRYSFSRGCYRRHICAAVHASFDTMVDALGQPYASDVRRRRAEMPFPLIVSLLRAAACHDVSLSRCFSAFAEAELQLPRLRLTPTVISFGLPGAKRFHAARAAIGRHFHFSRSRHYRHFRAPSTLSFRYTRGASSPPPASPARGV